MKTLFIVSIVIIVICIFVPILYKNKDIGEPMPLRRGDNFVRFIGFGTSLHNMSFRINKKDRTAVSYGFIYVFWIPLIPIGYYRHREYIDINVRRIKSSRYILHKEKSSAIEILTCYACSFAMIGAAVSGFMLLFN